MAAPAPVAPSASVPAFFPADATQPSFASLAAVQEPRFETQQLPPHSSSQVDLVGRETERSRSWRQGCERWSATESAGDGVSEAIEYTPEALNLNPAPLNLIPINPAPVTVALADMVIIEEGIPPKDAAKEKDEVADQEDTDQEDTDQEDTVQEDTTQKVKEPNPPGEGV